MSGGVRRVNHVLVFWSIVRDQFFPNLSRPSPNVLTGP